jgi:hypothetical protein
MTELVVFVVLAVAIFGVGIVLGMLIAPRLERLTEPDEDPGDGDDPADD